MFSEEPVVKSFLVLPYTLYKVTIQAVQSE